MARILMAVLIIVLTCWPRLSAGSLALCPRPGTPKHGDWCLSHSKQSECITTPPFYPGLEVSFKCNHGFQLVPDSSQTTVCRHDGTWSAETPICEKVVQESDWKRASLFIYMFGDKRSDYKETFQCDEYEYFHIQMKPRTPMSIRRTMFIKVEFCPGSGSEIEMSFKPVTRAQIYECSLFEKRFPVIIFKCQLPDFEVVNLDFIDIDVEERSIRLNDVTFMFVDDDYCGVPPVPVNATSERLSTRQYRYQCNEDLKLIGPELTTCNSSTGQWSSLPICSTASVIDWENPTTWIIAVVGAVVILTCVIGVCCIFKCRKKHAKYSSSQPERMMLRMKK